MVADSCSSLGTLCIRNPGVESASFSLQVNPLPLSLSPDVLFLAPVSALITSHGTFIVGHSDNVLEKEQLLWAIVDVIPPMYHAFTRVPPISLSLASIVEGQFLRRHFTFFHLFYFYLSPFFGFEGFNPK